MEKLVVVGLGIYLYSFVICSISVIYGIFEMFEYYGYCKNIMVIVLLFFLMRK